MTIYDDAPGNGFRIDRIWAFLSQGDGDNDEGVIQCWTAAGTALPLIAADEHRLEDLRPLARQVARDTGRAVKLVRFDTRTELETYE